MKVFSIVGWSGSGKTTLITQLIKEYRSNGKKVIAVKGSRHKYYLEPESTDTFKFMDAGAQEVLLVAERQLLIMKKIDSQTKIIEELIATYSKNPGCDLLIFEGLTADSVPVIEVFDAGTNPTLKFPIQQLAAVITDSPEKLPFNTASCSPASPINPFPVFSRNDILSIIRFMEENHE